MHRPRIYFATAAASETAAITRIFRGPDQVPQDAAMPLARGLFITQTGVGKAAAAAAISRIALSNTNHQYVVINLGIAGSLPSSGLSIGDRVLADPSLFGDEGICVRTGLIPIADVGFPAFGRTPDHAAPDSDLARRLRPLVDASGPVATVSAGSGTDAAAEALRRRTGALAEAMEGAAAALACERAGAAFAELRVISNTTGDRDRQAWDLPLALRRLGELASGVYETLSDGP